MQLDRDQFLQEGYLILRNVVPPDHLDTLRNASEIMVERQKRIWERQRKEGDPPGGQWETSNQPRLLVQRQSDLIDKQSASFVEFWLHENTLGSSSELLQTAHAAGTEMMMMCNPTSDRGPAKWHRDIHPIDTAPLQGYLNDIAENGPRYVQWNIPLYDDDVLWVIPGTHLRVNSAAEDRQILKDPLQPVPGGVQTHLNAGDGVVYITPILHWGSNYSTRMRRTLHGGYSNFTQYNDLSYIPYLSAASQAQFRRWEEQSARTQDLTESVLRAALAKDGAGFHAGLDKLQPGIGAKGKLLLTVYLCKAACYVNVLNNPDFKGIDPKLSASAANNHPTTLNWGPPFAARFTPQEARDLWRRFEPLDARLQADEEHFAPSFQSGPMRYFFNEMPTDYDVDSLIAAWGASTGPQK
jgi:hypothetical protein